MDVQSTTFRASGPTEKSSVVMGMTGEGLLIPAWSDLPESLVASLQKAMRLRREEAAITGRVGDLIEVAAPADSPAGRIVLCGLGSPADLDPVALQRAAGHAAALLMKRRARDVVLSICRPDQCEIGPAEFAAHLAYGASLRNYRYDAWLTQPRFDEPARFETLTVETPVPDDATSAFSRLHPVAAAVLAARELTDEPPNSLYPQAFAERSRALEQTGLEVAVMLPDEMARRGLNALLAVGRSSEHPPRLLTLRWHGRAGAETDLALVGKGITFDTGGLDMKKLDTMIQMKGDMAGGAAVVATLTALAQLRVPLNVVAAVPLAENAISGRAYRPSDIIRLASGQTIEVVNPDAEGRMALIDALWHICSETNPSTVISIGTLSGSAIEGLGRKYGGVYSEDDDLAAALVEAGRSSGEEVWRLPTSSDYDEDIRGSVSDLLQMAELKSGADGSHITRLLKTQVGARRWAYLEMSWLDRNWKDEPLCPKGSTGWGVRLMTRFAESLCG